MDLVYLTETIAYNSIRNPIYDRYDSPQWQTKYINNNYTQGRPKDNGNHKSGDKCKLCQEKKQRSLGNYIRSKSIECSTTSRITEEEEENGK